MDSHPIIRNASEIGAALKDIRTSMKRSLRECAGLLDIPVKTYMEYELGKDALSLPELELLALFLGVGLDEILYKDRVNHPPIGYLDDGKRQTFLRYQNKRIKSRVTLLMKENNTSLEQLQEATGIPLDALAAYKDGNQVIPISHLNLIANSFEKPLSFFFAPKMLPQNQVGPDQQKESTNAHPPRLQASEKNLDLYEELVKALQKIPKEDLAQVTKIILNIQKSR